MKLSYVFPILLALAILVFYMLLPPLWSCRLPKKKGGTDRRERLFIVALTAVYALVAFWKLGNTASPQTPQDMTAEPAIVELVEPAIPGRILLYSGLGMGGYDIQISADGENWIQIADFDQNHVAVLKWNEVTMSVTPVSPVQWLRLVGRGDAELLEIAVFDENGALLPIRSEAAALCDEQQLVPDRQTFMNSSYFDEIYHARTAWEHLRGVYPYEVSHPPLGKLILSVGIALFGMTPFGWRFSGTLLGVLMIPLIWLFAKRLFGGKTVPACVAALLASDFMHFVHTRIATIDTYGVFFTLLMYLFMYEFLTTGRRRMLALSGVSFALGAASKWTCFYAGAGLGVLWLCYWASRFAAALRPVTTEGESGPAPELRHLWKEFVENVLFCLVFFVLVPIAVYLLAYLPYAAPAGVKPFSADYFKLVWDNQVFMFTYHNGVHAEHPYSSQWYQWMLDIRPILYYLAYFDDGTRSSFGAWVNPLLCWGGLMSLFVLLYMAVARRDKKAAFLLVTYGAQLLPWVFITRTTFEYHYFPCAVFLTLCLGYVFALMCENDRRARPIMLAMTGISVVLFVVFYPALSGKPVNNFNATSYMKWLPTWPF